MYFIFSFWPFFAFGQVYTGFENGLGVEWDQFPENRWESSPDEALSGSFSLHHSFDNAASGSDRISFKTGTFNTGKAISWEFILKHGYQPSSANNWQVFLAVDKPASDPVSLNGYLLGVNVAGTDDTLRLYFVKNGSFSVIGTTSINVEKDISNSAFHCRIMRDSSAVWKVIINLTGNEPIIAGTFQEKSIEMPPLRHFMIVYNYTSSRDRLLWFDDLAIQASFITDTTPPELLSLEIVNDRQIQLIFSEDIESKDLQNEQFQLFPGDLKPERVTITGNLVNCYFRDVFTQKTEYQCITTGIKDFEGNLLIRGDKTFFFYSPEKNDIVISEIMADPSPPVYLRESEYVELYNRCGFSINLDSFILQTGKKEWLIPKVIMNPGEYLVLTDGAGIEGNIVSIFTSTSTISNDGQQIFLKDKNKSIITASEFAADWYGDDFRSQGGWSLERIDCDNLCGGKENWRVSAELSGGTPGWKNSVSAVNMDQSAPFIDRLELLNERKIRIVFSENVDPSSIPGPETFMLTPGMISADSVEHQDFFCSFTDIVFRDSLQKGILYELEIPENIYDCAGNKLQGRTGFMIGLPVSATFNDIIISEVMFSSLPGCPEYIELYNLSGSLFDVSDIRISVSQDGSALSPSIPLNTPVLFFPGQYIVLTKSKSALLACHDIEDPGTVIESKNLPSLRDDGACIRIFNRSLETLDNYCYDPADEFPMLSDFHGVSLERLVMDRKSGDESLWHSASSVSGFGTPGAENSQALAVIPAKSFFEVKQEIFSPDNDGRDDLLEINYSIEHEGYIGTVAIFDPTGRRICLPGENEILGTSGIFVWDGRDSRGNICQTGLYLVYAEIWNLKGDKQKFKKAVVLVRK